MIGFLATSANAEEFCIRAPYTAATSVVQMELVEIHREIASALSRFPTLGNTLASMAPTLCLSDHMDNAHGYVDVDENRIVIAQELTRNMRIGVMLHEIRHLQQLAGDACPSDDLAMKEYVRATFALEADASAISLLVAWDMAKYGNEEVWTALSTWPTHKDIADSFLKELARSGDSAAAAAAAFDQWYMSKDRREQYYLSTCSDYLDRQDSTHAVPQYRLLPQEFLESICTLPDGGEYPCSVPTPELR